MADFDTCIKFVLKHETYTNSQGVLVTLYEDSKTGECSNYGVSKALLKDLNYKIQDPRNLVMADILGIYQRVFWSPNYLGTVNSNLVAQKILDMCVNMGSGNGVKCTQAAMNSLGFPCVVDGAMGPHTMVTINQSIAGVGELKVVQELALKAISYYNSIAPKIINGEVDLPVWLARANDLGISVNYKAEV